MSISTTASQGDVTDRSEKNTSARRCYSQVPVIRNGAIILNVESEADVGCDGRTSGNRHVVSDQQRLTMEIDCRWLTSGHCPECRVDANVRKKQVVGERNGYRSGSPVLSYDEGCTDKQTII